MIRKTQSRLNSKGIPPPVVGSTAADSLSARKGFGASHPCARKKAHGWGTGLGWNRSGSADFAFASGMPAGAGDFCGVCRAFAAGAAILFTVRNGAATGRVRAFLRFGHDSSMKRQITIAAVARAARKTWMRD